MWMVGDSGQRPAPRFVVVMGVCGVGKTTTAVALAARLGASFVEADDLHPEENVALMAAGVPLGDDARGPWLDRICDRALALSDETGGPVVIACSALKRRYRDVFRRRLGPVLFLHLHGDPDEIRRRLQRRRDHFMPVSLLESQLADLELPDGEPDAARLSIERPPETIVEDAISVVQRSTAGPGSSEPPPPEGAT